MARCCVQGCTEDGTFGVGVRLAYGVQGRRFCHGHYLLTEDGQEMTARNLRSALDGIDFSE